MGSASAEALGVRPGQEHRGVRCVCDEKEVAFGVSVRVSRWGPPLPRRWAFAPARNIEVGIEVGGGV